VLDIIHTMAALIHLSRKKATKHPNLRWEKLNEFLTFANLASLSPAQRVAYLAYEYETHIVNIAGHADYFSSRRLPDCSEVVSALGSVGAVEQASILTAALEAVHAASTRAPGRFSDRFIAGIEYADLNEFDDALEQCKRSVPECLMAYLATHEADFIEWKP
jgi:hypothetical protein